MNTHAISPLPLNLKVGGFLPSRVTFKIRSQLVKNTARQSTNKKLLIFISPRWTQPLMSNDGSSLLRFVPAPVERSSHKLVSHHLEPMIVRCPVMPMELQGRPRISRPIIPTVLHFWITQSDVIPNPTNLAFIIPSTPMVPVRIEIGFETHVGQSLHTVLV